MVYLECSQREADTFSEKQSSIPTGSIVSPIYNGDIYTNGINDIITESRPETSQLRSKDFFRSFKRVAQSTESASNLLSALVESQQFVSYH